MHGELASWQLDPKVEVNFGGYKQSFHMFFFIYIKYKKEASSISAPTLPLWKTYAHMATRQH